MAEQPQESSDKNVEIWKIKKLIKSLEAARGYEQDRVVFVFTIDSFSQEWHKHDFIDHPTS